MNSLDSDRPPDFPAAHPAFTTHFTSPFYLADDPRNASDVPPFGTDEGCDTLAEWVERSDELSENPSLRYMIGREIVDVLVAEARYGESDADQLIIAHGFALLRTAGSIDGESRGWLSGALKRQMRRDKRPEYQQMLADLTSFAGAESPSSERAGQQGGMPQRDSQLCECLLPMIRSRKSITDRLRDAAQAQYPVRIERQHEWWADDVCGYVVGASKHWVAVQCLTDSVYFDGYEVVRLQDITDVADDRESGYIERAIAALGRPDVDYFLPEVATTSEVLQSASEHSALIRVFLEQECDHPQLVGPVTRHGKRKFDIQLIGPRGVWVVEPTRWWYKDVTRVAFGDRYSAALERFGDVRPSG